MPNLERVFLDFESPLWKATRIVWGETISIKGCSFHWAQRIFRKIKEYNLQVCINKWITKTDFTFTK